MIVYQHCGFLASLAEFGPVTYDSWTTDHDVLWRLTCCWVQGLLGEPVCWQRMPTIRTLADGQRGYPLHRERDFGHSTHTVNLWAPLSATAYGAVTIDGHDLRAMEPGECALFPGDCLHGSPGASVGPRVSIDARFLPLRLYEPSLARSDVAGVPLVLGEYYGHPADLLVMA